MKSKYIGNFTTYLCDIGGIGPLRVPHQSIVPFPFTASKLPFHVSLPTKS